MSRASFTDLQPCASSSFLELISSRTRPETAKSIDQAMQTHLHSSETQITALHISEIYSFVDDEICWQIVLWKEDQGGEVIALFNVEDGDQGLEECSWLMLVNNEGSKGGGCGSNISLRWNVTDISVLGTLFWAAQHALGILQMPKEAAKRLYCRENNDENSSEEYEPLPPKQSFVAYVVELINSRQSCVIIMSD
jgi:hypothetical protein